MITISISSYNQAEYLPEAIESCLLQVRMPYEIIIGDDGSTDNSLKIAQSYLSGKGQSVPVRVRVISQVNKGLSSARNTGLMNASGDYFLPLDADDILQPQCVERIEEEIKKSNADIISPSFKTFGISNVPIILMSNPTIEDFKIANRVGYCSAIKTSVLKEVGGYSSRMHTGYEDLHLWFDLLSRGATITTIPEILWLYRTKEKSMWHDALKHHEELMAQIRKDFPDVTNIINDPLPR